MADIPHNRFSRKTALLFLILAGSIWLFIEATQFVSRRNSDLLGVAVVLAGSILGIAIARSIGCKSLFASILGGAAGCAIEVGVSMFLQVLLIPPEPGTVYKFGGGIGSAIAGLLGGLFLGGFSGSIVGLIAGLARKIP